MTAAKPGMDSVIISQTVAAPLTRSAIFLVVIINPGPDHRTRVRSFCAELPALFRAVEFRNLEAGLTCVMGIGSQAHGTACSATRGRPSCTRFGKFGLVRAERYRRQVISCSISARSAWSPTQYQAEACK
jgi:hypothetical protein